MGVAVTAPFADLRRGFAGGARDGLALAFGDRRAWLVVAAVTFFYAAAYLLLARGLIVDAAARFSRFSAIPSLRVAPDLSWRYLADVFNPPVILYLGDAIALAPTVPIAAAALVLGALVGANLTVALATLRHRATSCARSSAVSVIGSLPSFLATFTCCAPTVLFVLGANFAVAVVAAVPYVVPLAATFLVGSLVWSARRLSAMQRESCGAA